MTTPRPWLWLLVAPALFAMACSGNNTSSPTPTPTPTPGPSLTAYLAGAGDIADCTSVGADRGAHGEATAKLIDRMPDAVVFTAGDNAYLNGTAAEFANCYGPRWGRFKNRTYPSPGNHEYDPPTFGIPYYDYFGGRAGPAGRGFYSYELGNRHIVSLNSNVPAGAGSEQVLWLDNDLRNNPAKCTLAYWHHPLFTSGPSAGTGGLMREVWRVLYERGVEVVVNGHDHLYERFNPQDPSGRPDAPAGIRQYTVGTGGAPLYDFGPTVPTSAFKTNRSYGVIRFTLREVGWDSVFVEAGTEALIDLSLGNLCH